MRFTLSLFVLLFAIVVFSNSSCKKNKPTPINTTCGCDAIKTEFIAIDLPCKLVYQDYSRKWLISYYYQAFYFIFIPCNSNQDSLKAIVKDVRHDSLIPVTFSGKVKIKCPDEVLGYFAGNSAVYKTIIDSLKRN